MVPCLVSPRGEGQAGDAALGGDGAWEQTAAGRGDEAPSRRATAGGLSDAVGLGYGFRPDGQVAWAVEDGSGEGGRGARPS